MSFRDEFANVPGWVHLNNAGTCPLPVKARETLRRLIDLQVERGASCIPDFYAELDQARTIFARFLGTKNEHIAFTANLATSISQVAWALPFREGDGILTIDQEYPSNAYAWIAVAKAKNLRREVFASRDDLSIDWDQFLSRIRPGVRAVAISWVQYKAGTTAPLKAIGEACRRHGAWLVVDAIQGLGAMPFDLREAGVDIVCGGTHKWLCGLTGQGFIGFRDELYLQMIPHIQGTATFGLPDTPVDPNGMPVARATRFESGAPGHMAAIAAATSVGLIMQAGVPAIRATALGLRERLIDGLQGFDCRIIGDPPGSKSTSSIVTFQGRNLQAAYDELNKAGISSVLRPHGLRLSPHGFNTDQEIDQALEIIGRYQK